MTPTPRLFQSVASRHAVRLQWYKNVLVAAIGTFLFWLAMISFTAPAHAGQVCASGGRHCVNVASSARSILQCVVDHVEAAGVRVTALGGYRHGRCSTSSMHPCGLALDINQTRRDVNGPPRSISSAAASACGAVSGSWWAGNPDNGHFQVGGWAGTHGPGTTTYAARLHRRRHYAHRYHRRVADL